MYLKFYQFNKEPFNITPDPEFLYLSPDHKEALASIIYGVEQRKGFIAVFGDIGVGKTTILRSYLSSIDRHKLIAIYLLNPMLSFANLLKILHRELGLSSSSLSNFEMMNQLHEHLIHEYVEGRNVVLIIDEAQNMPVDTLENLRMLSNIETTNEKLIQVVFSAQPEFEKTLNLQELKQLKQRIAVKTVISPLSKTEGMTYIRHRLKKAAVKESVIFTSCALKEIVRMAEGIPRVINILCDNSLITAFGYGKKVIGLGVVREVIRDFGIQRSFLLNTTLQIILGSLLLILGYFAISPNISLTPTRHPLPQHSVTGQPYNNASRVKKQNKIHLKNERDFIDRIVEKGDTLARLVKEVYGHVDEETIRMVKKANPTISNEDLIIVGHRIIFPLRVHH